MQSLVQAIVFLRRGRARISILVLAALVLFAPAEAVSVRGAEEPTEYEVKAAFLYNFAKFVVWPERAFASTNAPFVIGIIGDVPFANDLEAVVQGKAIDGHPVVIKRFERDARPEYTHVLFVSRSERRRLRQLLESLKDTATLTVGDEIDNFLRLDGVINFIMEGRRVRFEINHAAANRAGLKISSKLLKLAVRTSPRP